MKKVAIIMDGGFVSKKIKSCIGKKATSEDIYKFAMKCIKNAEEEIFRIFYYDCYPYDGKAVHPITQIEIDFSSTQTAVTNSKLLNELSQKDYMAIRKGQLAFRGWEISKYATNRLQNHIAKQQIIPTSQSGVQNLSFFINDKDFQPSFDQKEVDIKIGLDVAWLAMRKIVDKIILVTGDTDLIPAMKFARKEGVQVVITNIQNDKYLTHSLKEHADEVRKVQYDATSQDWSVSIT